MKGHDSPPAPAVARAFQILEYLANAKAEAGASEIATALEMNKSTCFNILKTLMQESAVIRNSNYPAYRLGPRLVELGTASRRNFSRREQIGVMVRPLVESTGITCLISQPLPADRGAIVIDRVIPRGRDAVTAPIGQVYPITAPAMGRVLLAVRDIEEVLAAAPDQPDLDEEELLRLLPSLDEVWEKGYGWSVEEFQEAINAVAAPVLGADGQVTVLLCLIGRREHFPAERIDDYGVQLRDVARRVEAMLLRDSGVGI